MKYHYPRRRRGKLEGDVDVVRITLHSEGLVDQLKSKEDLLNTLISFAGHELVEIAFTPLPHGHENVGNLDKLKSIQYKDQPGLPTQNHFVAVLESRQSMARNPIDGAVVSKLWSYEEETPESREVLSALKAVFAHEALGRDVFVTECVDVLGLRDWIGDRSEVWIVSTAEALDCLGTYLISKTDYTVFIKPPFHYKVDALLYYWLRLCELVPAFPPAWSTVVVGEAMLRNGADLMGHMASFYRRVLDMMEAKDRISTEFYKPGNNLTKEEVLSIGV